jgi:hypothetical protein
MSADSDSKKPFAIDIDRLPNLPELSPEKRAQLERDLAHPLAATTTHRLYELDARAETHVGEPAPDFELSRLDSPDERVRLSSHFEPAGGGRPVALVFGSYT